MARLLHRRPASLVALAGLVTTFAVTGVVTHAAVADPLADARAHAAALARTVDQLQTRAEVATERYNKAESLLSQAVAEQGRADQALNAVQADAAAAQQEVVDRTRALYESGGDPAVLAAMLSGSDPANAMDRYHLATAVIAYQTRSAARAAQTVASAESLDRHDAQVTRQVTRLQVAARHSADLVTSLLDTQQAALADATATVRRLARADQAAAAAAGAASFAAAVKAAGGVLDASTQPPNNVTAMAIAAAKTRLGDPYVWGATGPHSFDCSGLTQWAYAHAGITLPRVAADQHNAGPHPSMANLEPGDLLFWATDTSAPATIHHVTMYLGDGMMIAAPHTGTDVQIQPVYMPGFIGATRPWSSN